VVTLQISVCQHSSHTFSSTSSTHLRYLLHIDISLSFSFFDHDFYFCVTEDFDPRLHDEPEHWYDGVHGWNQDPPSDSLKRSVQDLVQNLGFDGLWWHITSGRDITLANELSIRWHDRDCVVVYQNIFGLFLSDSNFVPLTAGSWGILRNPDCIVGNLVHIKPDKYSLQLHGHIAIIEEGICSIEEMALRVSRAGAVALVVLRESFRNALVTDTRAERLALDTRNGVIGEIRYVRSLQGEKFFILDTVHGDAQVPESALLRFDDVRKLLPVFFAHISQCEDLKAGEPAKLQIATAPIISMDIRIQRNRFHASRIAFKFLALSSHRPIDEIFICFSFFTFNTVRDFPASCHHHRSCAKQKEFYWISDSKAGTQDRKTQFNYSEAAGLTFEFLVLHTVDKTTDKPNSTTAQFIELERYLVSSSMELHLWARHQGTFFCLGRAIFPLSQLCRREKRSVLFAGSLPLQNPGSVTECFNMTDEDADRVHIRAINIGMNPLTSSEMHQTSILDSTIQIDASSRIRHLEIGARLSPRMENISAGRRDDVNSFMSVLKFGEDVSILDSLVRSEQVCPCLQSVYVVG
jgi:hypothetical protein